MSFFKCIYHLLIIQTPDNSNNILDNDNNIKESLLDKYLDVSNNSNMIFESDVEPLLQKEELFFQTETLVREKVNDTVDKNQSKKNFLNQYKKSFCGVKLSKVEDPQQMKTEIVKKIESKTEELKEKIANSVESKTEEVNEIAKSIESKTEELKEEIANSVESKTEEVNELVKSIESKTEELKEEIANSVESKTEEINELAISIANSVESKTEEESIQQI